jgi:glyoxylase-like metal-dependent hydrolase (beta-lactamase superfamily II)
MPTVPALEDLLVREDDVTYGVAQRLSPLVRRVVANNPGPYTLYGTATFVVGARDRLAVIDPGPLIPDHVDRLLETTAGATISHILVTHTHLDHSPAAALLKERADAPVYGFGPHAGGAGSGLDDEGADTAFAPDRVMRDGDTVAGDGWTLQAVHTPGHTSNHLCFRLPEEGTLFSGDHVMGWSSTVISPPDGDLTAYLASLDRLLAGGDRLLRPTHGRAITDPARFLNALKAHRLRRCDGVLASLRTRPRQIPEIVAENYVGLDPVLFGAACRSVYATLLHLQAEGSVRAEGTDEEATWHLP